MTRKDRLVRRQAFITLLTLNDPQFFVTLTFKRPYSDRTSISTADHFIRRLQKSLPNRHRGKVEGVVAGERHSRAWLNDSLHFHMLLWGFPAEPGFGTPWLQATAWKAAEALRGPRGGRMCRSGPANVDVQPVDFPEGAARYATKELGKFHRPAGDQLWFVHAAGTEGALLA